MIETFILQVMGYAYFSLFKRMCTLSFYAHFTLCAPPTYGPVIGMHAQGYSTVIGMHAHGYSTVIGMHAHGYSTVIVMIMVTSSRWSSNRDIVMVTFNSLHHNRYIQSQY